MPDDIWEEQAVEISMIIKGAMKQVEEISPSWEERFPGPFL